MHMLSLFCSTSKATNEKPKTLQHVNHVMQDTNNMPVVTLFVLQELHTVSRSSLELLYGLRSGLRFNVPSRTCRVFSISKKRSK